MTIMRSRVPWPQLWYSMSMATFIVMVVLVASVVLAAFLAEQAIAATRSRQAVSDAMLRQYAQLAAWEFSREARRDIESALQRSFVAEAHPSRRMSGDGCDCGGLAEIEQWFQVSPEGTIESRRDALPAETLAALQQTVHGEGGGPMEGAPRIRRLSADDARLVAVRWEPHLGAAGGQIGFIAQPAAFTGLLSRTHSRVVLLPPLLSAGRDPRALVDLRISDGTGQSLFASRDTAPGPQPIETELFPQSDIGFRVHASMTPAFVATLGPEHGAGPRNALLVGLVVVNALLVIVGVWQLTRERELARLRADFVAGVSHELRTPLAQIRMFAETLLLDRIRNPQEGRRALEIIGQETRRLGQLVENILYFHRHRKPDMAYPREPIDLAELISEVVEGFMPLAASRRVRLELRVESPGVVTHANADGLRQVLINLLDNAVKFGPSGEPVSIDLGVVNGTARIAVEDRGPGVPPADRTRIFQPFERGRNSRAAGGAGIGLAVVHEIVRAHNGDIQVVPAAGGRGARFLVSLPLPDREPRAQDVVSLAG